MSERPEAGSIVLVDWRGGAKPAEPTKIRPAVVVDDHELFPSDYPNCIVVPLTHDARLAYASFSERIDPAPENGADATSWALAHHVTTVSLRTRAIDAFADIAAAIIESPPADRLGRRPPTRSESESRGRRATAPPPRRLSGLEVLTVR